MQLHTPFSPGHLHNTLRLFNWHLYYLSTSKACYLQAAVLSISGRHQQDVRLHTRRHTKYCNTGGTKKQIYSKNAAIPFLRIQLTSYIFKKLKWYTVFRMDHFQYQFKSYYAVLGSRVGWLNLYGNHTNADEETK